MHCCTNKQAREVEAILAKKRSEASSNKYDLKSFERHFEVTEVMLRGYFKA